MYTTYIFNIIDFIYKYFVSRTDEYMSSLVDLYSKLPHILIGSLVHSLTSSSH